ncbi:MAG: hypothetical protein AB1Z21_12360 [Synechococcaceae cyanobacterium]
MTTAKPWIALRPSWCSLSFRVDRRVPAVLVALAALVLLSLIVNVSQGSTRCPWRRW